MAFPSLIGKLLDLRAGSRAHTACIISQAREIMRLDNHVTALELEKIQGSGFVEINISGDGGKLGPGGYLLPGGAKVAPVTITDSVENAWPGSALTMVVGKY